MADNYLERRMEDMRAGRLSSPLKHIRKTGTGKSASSGLTDRKRKFTVPHGYVLITDKEDRSLPDIEVMIKEERAKGNKVAFCAADWRQGSILAQRHGARFYHTDPAAPTPDTTSDTTQTPTPQTPVSIIADLRAHWRLAPTDQLTLL